MAMSTSDFHKIQSVGDVPKEKKIMCQLSPEQSVLDNCGQGEEGGKAVYYVQAPENSCSDCQFCNRGVWSDETIYCRHNPSLEGMQENKTVDPKGICEYHRKKEY